MFSTYGQDEFSDPCLPSPSNVNKFVMEPWGASESSRGFQMEMWTLVNMFDKGCWLQMVQVQVKHDKLKKNDQSFPNIHMYNQIEYIYIYT